MASTLPASSPNSFFISVTSFWRTVCHCLSASSGLVPCGSSRRMSWSEAPPLSGSPYFLPETHEPSPMIDWPDSPTVRFTTSITRVLVGAWAGACGASSARQAQTSNKRRCIGKLILMALAGVLTESLRLDHAVALRRRRQRGTDRIASESWLWGQGKFAGQRRLGMAGPLLHRMPSQPPVLSFGRSSGDSK